MTSLPIAGASRHSVYTGRTTSWPMVASSSTGALLIVLMGTELGRDGSDWWVVLPLLLVALGVLANVLTASSVRATAGPNGFTIRWGAVGWPRCSYRLDEIAGIDVIDLPWWRVTHGSGGRRSGRVAPCGPVRPCSSRCTAGASSPSRSPNPKLRSQHFGRHRPAAVEPGSSQQERLLSN